MPGGSAIRAGGGQREGCSNTLCDIRSPLTGPGLSAALYFSLAVVINTGIRQNVDRNSPGTKSWNVWSFRDKGLRKYYCNSGTKETKNGRIKSDEAKKKERMRRKNDAIGQLDHYQETTRPLFIWYKNAKKYNIVCCVLAHSLQIKNFNVYWLNNVQNVNNFFRSETRAMIS